MSSDGLGSGLVDSSGTAVVVGLVAMVIGVALMTLLPPDAQFVRRDVLWTAECGGLPIVAAALGQEHADAEPIRPDSVAVGPPSQETHLLAEKACYSEAKDRVGVAFLVFMAGVALLSWGSAVYLKHKHGVATSEVPPKIPTFVRPSANKPKP